MIADTLVEPDSEAKTNKRSCCEDGSGDVVVRSRLTWTMTLCCCPYQLGLLARSSCLPRELAVSLALLKPVFPSSVAEGG